MLIRNPANDEAVTEVEETQPASVDELMAAARDAQRSWAASPLSERLSALSRFRNLLAERSEDLAHTLTSETGKPISQSRNELAGTLPRIDFFLENTAEVMAGELVTDAATGTEERITLEPLGVVANISAWNYPWFVGTNVIVPALLTGNTVIYKPSELATLTGLAIQELMNDSDVPSGVFTTVVGAGELGSRLVDVGPDGLFFTGSYGTGRRIAEAYAGHLGVLQLELGGKDPAYVAEDADPQAAATALADGAFYNNGQSCCSVERIYVHASLHDEFVQAFVAEVEAMKMGDPFSERTYLGPLTRPAQAGVLTAQVAQATEMGADVLCGGRQLPGPGTWFEPTVIVGVNHRMDLMTEESFGPAIGIQVVADDTAAAALMADTSYGLTAGVFTPSRERAESILDGLEVGSAYWNCCDRVSPTLPWSGRHHSGVG
ncbi:MAG: aldehyde dehydrogenase family protein, partial [Microthrixaceae bacterium]